MGRQTGQILPPKRKILPGQEWVRTRRSGFTNGFGQAARFLLAPYFCVVFAAVTVVKPKGRPVPGSCSKERRHDHYPARHGSRPTIPKRTFPRIWSGRWSRGTAGCSVAYGSACSVHAGPGFQLSWVCSRFRFPGWRTSAAGGAHESLPLRSWFAQTFSLVVPTAPGLVVPTTPGRSRGSENTIRVGPVRFTRATHNRLLVKKP